MGLVHLEPGPVHRLLGIEDQPVEIEDDGADHRPNVAIKVPIA